MSYTNRAICLSMKTYFVTSISFKTFNLCWLLFKNKVQLIIKNLLTKESNMLSSRIKKILIESKSLNLIFMFIWIIYKSYHWRFLYFCALRQNFHVCFNSWQMKHLLVKINRTHSIKKCLWLSLFDFFVESKSQFFRSKNINIHRTFIHNHSQCIVYIKWCIIVALFKRVSTLQEWNKSELYW